MLIEHLLSLGHTRIAFAAGPHFVTSADQRRVAFDHAVTEIGLTGYTSPIRADVPHGEERQITGEWLRSIMSLPAGERPTAFIGWNDAAARMVIGMLSEMGLRVPADVNVVGFDDAGNVSEGEATPRLTTYRQPYRLIGRRAVELCLERFESLTTESRVELIPGKLVVRQSSGPAAASPNF
jgi:DNA-binding LacI/PurR family transcriptional regulator